MFLVEKNKLEEGYTTRDMAGDYNIALEQLGISNAYVMGISQGGMIAQYLAIDYPDKVKKLVLGVTVSRQNGTVKNVVESWIAMAKADDYKSLIIDTVEKSYTEKLVKKYRLLYPIISRVGKPDDFTRFFITSQSMYRP